MKLRQVFVVCLSTLFLFSACSPMQSLMEDPDTDALMVDTIHAIENKNINEFKALFLPSALPADESDALDLFEKITEYYQGTMTS